MANSLVIREGTSLAKRSRALRAAQYVRMSTDYQRYSIQNQAAAIAAFAQQQNLAIVCTYIDEGRSGLRFKGRIGLIELIDDVRSGRADFGHIRSTMSAAGDAFRMSTKVLTTNLSVSRMASRSPTAPNSLTMTGASCQASSKTSSV